MPAVAMLRSIPLRRLQASTQTAAAPLPPLRRIPVRGSPQHRPASISTTTAPSPTSSDKVSPGPGVDTQRGDPSPGGPPRPYFVNRTHSNNLPVFHERKAGGNQLWTLVKKGQGDVPALADHLAAALGLPRETLRINPVNNHIKIKVRRVPVLLCSAGPPLEGLLARHALQDSGGYHDALPSTRL